MTVPIPIVIGVSQLIMKVSKTSAYWRTPRASSVIRQIGCPHQNWFFPTSDEPIPQENFLVLNNLAYAENLLATVDAKMFRWFKTKTD